MSTPLPAPRLTPPQKPRGSLKNTKQYHSTRTPYSLGEVIMLLSPPVTPLPLLLLTPQGPTRQVAGIRVRVDAATAIRTQSTDLVAVIVHKQGVGCLRAGILHTLLRPEYLGSRESCLSMTGSVVPPHVSVPWRIGSAASEFHTVHAGRTDGTEERDQSAPEPRRLLR